MIEAFNYEKTKTLSCKLNTKIKIMDYAAYCLAKDEISGNNFTISLSI